MQRALEVRRRRDRYDPVITSLKDMPRGCTLTMAGRIFPWLSPGPRRGALASSRAAAIALLLCLSARPGMAAAEPIAGAALAKTPGPSTEAAAGAAGPNGPADAGTPARLRLISQSQYFNTLGYVFGPDISIAAHFAPFRRTEGLLATGASSAGVTAGQMQEFQRTAAALAEKVVSPQNRAFLIPCTPRSPTAADPACARQFLSSVGRLLYRRPMRHEEVVAVVAKAGEAATRLKDFYAGLGSALEGLLLAPETLFIHDTTEPDPARPGHRRLDAYAMASRMSFFLWNAAPDDDLLRRAQRGELQTEDGRAAAVDAMLKSQRLETGVRAFFDDMLEFDEFAVLSKDPMIYPAFVGDVVQDAREQTLRTLVDHLLVQDRDYRDLFTTRETFLSPPLATLYGVPAPPGWSKYEMPADSPRVGLLTQVAFLASHAHPGRSSATRRGKALRELLLCQVVPRPPPNVDFSLVENPKSTIKTARERLALHRSNPVCAGCHKITDPIGLALENFDGAGQYRATERGAPIDASGALDGKQFSDPIGLGQALHDHPGLPACVVKRAYAYGTGGPTSAGDKPTLAWLGDRFAQSGYRMRGLLRTIVTSHAFSQVVEPASTPPPVKSAGNGPAPASGGAAADTEGAAR